MKITYPISTDDGDGYLVLMESFEKSVLPDDIIEALGNVEIVDVTLEEFPGHMRRHPVYYLRYLTLLQAFCWIMKILSSISIVMICTILPGEIKV